MYVYVVVAEMFGDVCGRLFERIAGLKEKGAEILLEIMQGHFVPRCLG